MSFEAGERIAQPSRAYRAAMRVCGELGLVPRFRRFGTHLQSWNCELYKQTQLQTNGRGKGLGQQSKTSALCEAIEHYLYEADDRSFDRYLQLDLSGADARLAEGSPDFSLLLGDRAASFSRITFTRMNGDGQELYLPAFLQSPTYKSRREEENELISRLGLLRYGTNNGTASGLTNHEAALHALLEIIERDAVGIEMLRVIVSREPVPVRSVRLDTLPDALASLCRKAGEEATGSVRVWDITSDIGIPVFLAALDAPNRSYFGSGAALSSAYALERALLEAVQSFHVYEHMGSPPPLRGRTNFDETSHYQRCFLEAGHFSFRGGSSEVDFKEVPSESFSTHADMERNVAWVVRALLRRGIATFWRSLFEGKFSVVQVVAPRLERFHLVTQGVPVAPGARGRSFMLGS